MGRQQLHSQYCIFFLCVARFTRACLRQYAINLIAISFVIKYSHLGTNVADVAALALTLPEHVRGATDIAVADVCRKRKCLLAVIMTSYHYRYAARASVVSPFVSN